MIRQVITIYPDGSIHGLQHKKGQGVDLRKFGRASIKRITLIEWDEERSAWFVKWADSGVIWTPETFQEAGVLAGDFRGSWTRSENLIPPVYFPDYEDAVAAEVAVYQALQLEGKVAA